MRRFDRWLQNKRIEVHQLYGPLIQNALAEWGTNALYLALDTSTLWDMYCLVRISLIYRGRAIPIVWKVLQHPSSSVAYAAYADLLDTAASLLPPQCRVIFLADRGFADAHLMGHLRRLDWHWRIRFKSSFWMYRCGHRPCKANRLALALGEARFWHHVYITKVHYGPVHLVLARCKDGKEEWFVVSDEPTDMKTFEEYRGSVPFSVKETGDGLSRTSPRHNVLTCLVPFSTVCWFSHGHRCLPAGDSTQMMPQPTFIENGTDPIPVTI